MFVQQSNSKAKYTIQYQRILTVGVSITVQLVSSLTDLDLVDSVHTNNNIFSCLVTSNPIKLETRYTVIFPPTESVFRKYYS